jgi:DKNYY family
MILKRLFWFVAPLIGLAGCGTGYQQDGNLWVWVTVDEQHGRRAHPILMADAASFKVLSDKNYAVDQHQVYYQGRALRGADPATFQLLTGGYGKDKREVFLDTEPVVLADPATFEVLAFPYARDRERVFCGTLPLTLQGAAVQAFRVTNTDKLMANTKSTSPKSVFIEFQPEYKWLDEHDVELVITGPWGTGESGGRKFQGVKEL